MDSDFLILASQSVPHAGIAYVGSSTSIGAVIGSLMLLRDVLTPDDMIDHVEFL
jgi:hypothetical protein